MIAHVKGWIGALDASRGWKSYLGPYTAIFILMMMVMSFSLLLAGKGFIWDVDGLSQQYVFFVYEGMWLRELVGDVLAGQDLPLWTSQIGWGGDPFITLLSCIGDPLNLISAFIPMQAADIVLNLTVPLRLYIAGLIFSGFCFYKGNARFATLSASMVYLFGGFTTIAFTQIFMLYPLVLGPLVLWGAEKLFGHESPLLFIVSMALAFLAGLTFGYATCLLLLLFCVVRFIFMDGQKGTRLFFGLFARFLGCIVLGMVLSAIILVPSALAILGQGRIGLERPEGLLYDINYYRDLLLGFGGIADVGADCSYGFSAVAIICVFLLFSQKPADLPRSREVKIMRTLFVIMVIFLCIPIIGRIFNGFAYANNRWVWAFVLLMGYIVASMLPGCLAVRKETARKVFRYAVVYALLITFLLFPFVSRNALFGMVMLFAVLVLLLGSLGLSRIAKQGGVLLSIILSAAFVFNTYSSQFVDSGSKWAMNMVGLGRASKVIMDNDPTTELKQVEDDEFWRYDTANVIQVHNGNLLQGLNALRFYSSYYNQAIDDLQTGLGLRTSSMNFMYAGLDSRTPLESLAGVRYFVSAPGAENLIPTTFETYAQDVEISDKRFDYSESDYALPLIYLHESVIKMEEYTAMTPMQKQEALLQGAVLGEGEGVAALKQAELAFSGQQMDSSFTYVDGTPIQVHDGRDGDMGIAYDGESFRVYNKDARILLHTYAVADADTYVYIPSFSFENLLPSDRMSEAQKGDTPLYQRERLAFEDAFLGKGIYDAKVYFTLDGVRKELWGPTSATHLYGGKDEWVVNMGHSVASADAGSRTADELIPVTIELTFQDPGIYSFGDLRVTSEPAEQTKADVRALQERAETGISDVRSTGSSLSCTVQIENKADLVYFSIPFSEGWSATIDGQPVEIQRANVGFMGIVADAGEHQIELRYMTPGLVPGAILSLIGLVVLTGIVIFRRRICINTRKGR